MMLLISIDDEEAWSLGQVFFPFLLRIISSLEVKNEQKLMFLSY
jgi:hypothetical protein